MREKLVSIVIVNWNGGEVFRQCLESLKKVQYPNWELVIVDNGSTDGSVEEIQNSKFKIQNYNSKFKIIQNRTNLGFAVANNQGYNVARGEYVLLLNNDTRVEPDFLNILVERLEDDKTLGVIQPKILLMDKPGYLDNAGSFLTRTGFLEHWGFMRKDGPEFEKEQEIFSAKGACMLIKKEVVNKVGLFDNEFGSYFEETDFCWRVWLAGYKVIFYPKARIYHKVGFTSRRQDQLFVNYHSFKNRIRSLIKNLGARNLLLIGGVHIVLLMGLGFYYLLRLHFDKCSMIGRAILWNVLNLRETLQERGKTQGLRITPDKEIFTYILRKTNWKEMFSHFGKVEANFG